MKSNPEEAPQTQEAEIEIESLIVSDSELLTDIMGYLESHIGALDMIHEALAENRPQVSEEIARTPEEALNSLADNLIDKTTEIQAKRDLSSNLSDTDSEN